jgi:hypothetical protein
MQDDATASVVAEQERTMDHAILELLLTPDEQRPWSVRVVTTLLAIEPT